MKIYSGKSFMQDLTVTVSASKMVNYMFMRANDTAVSPVLHNNRRDISYETLSEINDMVGKLVVLNTNRFPFSLSQDDRLALFKGLPPLLALNQSTYRMVR